MQNPRLIARLTARLVALCLLAWTVYFVSRAFLAPFPLDSFEDYEIWRSTRIIEGGSLYRPPGSELFPTPYPPGFYLTVAAAEQLTARHDYLPGRSVSLLSFLIWAGICYATARRTGSWTVLAVAALIALGYRGSARYYTIGRPDMLMGSLLAVAMVLASRRSRPAVFSGGLFAALAVYCKQTALPIALVVSWIVEPDRRALYLLAFTASCLLFAASFVALGGLPSAWYWCVVWPAGHGFSLARALATCTENWQTTLAVLVLPITMLVVSSAPVRAILVSLAATLSALVALGKWGAIENHFLIALVPQTLLLARYRPAAPLAYAAATMALLTLAVHRLPDARELHWFAKRHEEAESWAQAVQALDGAVAHYAVLGATHGTRFAGFSDLALKLPGYLPSPFASENLLRELPPVVVLSAAPAEWNSTTLAEAFTSRYAFEGKLEFKERSGILPRLVFVRKPVLASKSEASHNTIVRSEEGTRIREGRLWSDATSGQAAAASEPLISHPGRTQRR